jgi:hypothetical protein
MNNCIKKVGCALRSLVPEAGTYTQKSCSISSIGFAGSVAIILSVAVAVRLLASHNDFWLDEIMSLSLALRVESPWQIITKIHLDNNHILNTFYIYLVGNQQNWIVYRVPSVIAGSATVLIAGLIGNTRGRIEALFAMILMGWSYILINFSSEARGYALMLMIALLAFCAMWRFMEEKKGIMALLFGISSIIGFLTHLTFIFFYCATALWSGSIFIRERRNWKEAMRNLAYCHALPVLFFLFLYIIKIQHMVLAGGEKFPLLEIIMKTLALTAGAPFHGIPAFVASLIISAGFIWGVQILQHEKSRIELFFIALISINIANFLKSEFSDVRYFLICVEFLLLALAFFLGHLYRSGNLGKIVAALLIIFYIAGNALYISDLLKYGRGGYLNALLFIYKQSKGNNIIIGSDHDFRNKLTIAYYLRNLPKNKDVHYYNHDPKIGFSDDRQDEVMSYIKPFLVEKSENFDYRFWPQEGPEWFIIHGIYLKNLELSPRKNFKDYLGNHYSLVGIYKCGGVSGLNWYVYHNNNRDRGNEMK